MNRNPSRWSKPAMPDETHDENRPIANVRRVTTQRIGTGIQAMLMAIPILMVVVAGNGDVFAVDPSGLRAEAVTSRHPDWIIGTYTRRCGVGAIQRDIREHLRLAREAA